MYSRFIVVLLPIPFLQCEQESYLPNDLFNGNPVSLFTTTRNLSLYTRGNAGTYPLTSTAQPFRPLPLSPFQSLPWLPKQYQGSDLSSTSKSKFLGLLRTGGPNFIYTITSRRSFKRFPATARTSVITKG